MKISLLDMVQSAQPDELARLIEPAPPVWFVNGLPIPDLAVHAEPGPRNSAAIFTPADVRGLVKHCEAHNLECIELYGRHRRRARELNAVRAFALRPGPKR